MAQSQTLTWIHLSDLHIEPEDGFNRKIVLDALWRDIEGFVGTGMLPDFVAFTGDVSYHGNDQEYDLATKEFFEPLLEITKITRDRLFIIPGNHDASRLKTSMLRNPIPLIDSQDSIRRMLSDKDQREFILAPFSSYRSFARSSTHQSIEEPVFGYCQEFEKGDFLVSVIGLNSAWLSGFNKNERGEVDDFGKLAVGEFQIIASLPQGTHFKIVLMHHPFDWLCDLDRDAVKDWLARNRCVVLRGHLHRSDILSESSLAGDLLIIPAGAVYDGRRSPNAYNIVQADLASGNCISYLRRYNHVRNEWQKDIESTGEKLDGKVSFRLPGFWYEATMKAGEKEPSANVRDYELIFTDTCKADLAACGLEDGALIELVQGEFRSHLNYFIFDLEDYPLPLRMNYIVYMNKIGRRIEFRRLVRCTKNEACLASWNDILALYRRATRLAYREDPAIVLTNRGLVGRTSRLHLDLRSRIDKHFRAFHGKFVSPPLREVQREDARASVPAEGMDLEAMADEIAFHMAQSYSATHEAYEVVKAMDIGDIMADEAISMIVSELERSLQHIHKILLRYPPID